MVVVSYLDHYDTFLENETDIITKCDSYFIIECKKRLLQNVSGISLQNTTVVTKCDAYLKNASIHGSYRFVFNPVF